MLLHRRGDVAVEVERDPDPAVAEALRDNLRVDALTEQERGSAVAEIVEADAGDGCSL